jgi:hypothetical protein
MMIAATGNRPHALAGAMLSVETLEQLLCFLRRQAVQVYSGQSRVERFLFGGIHCTP